LVSIHFFLAHALTAEIYSLSLHDALPIYVDIPVEVGVDRGLIVAERPCGSEPDAAADLPASADDRRQDRGGLVIAARRDRARQDVAGAVDADRLLHRALPRPDARRLPDVDPAVARGVAGRRDRAADDDRTLELAAREVLAGEGSAVDLLGVDRSEERRVGKEWRCGL